MTITTTLELENAIESDYTTIFASKASILDVVAGQPYSHWQTTGTPAAGALPGTIPVVLTNASTGALNFKQQSGGRASYLAELAYAGGTALNTVEIHDRMVHMSGLSANTTGLQTVTGFDLATLGSTSNLAERKGDANYSDVQWFMENFVDHGSTNSNATVNVTYNDGTTGNLTVFVIGNNERRIYRMFSLNSLIPAADSGKFIRGINSLQLSLATGLAGNLGFVATRYRGSITCDTIGEQFKSDWVRLALPQIYNSSCLSMINIGPGSASGATQLLGKIVHG